MGVILILSSPRVSVLMAVHNGEQTLRSSIDSIFSQSLSAIELIVVDDASSDRTIDVLQSYNDPRLHVIRNEKQLLLAHSLNIGFQFAKGEYIARMDADDIAFPHRLAKQLSFMEEHPFVAICGCWIEHFGDLNGIVKFPEQHDEIACQLLFGNALAHPTAFFRKEVFLNLGIRYNSEFQRAQDYDLWSRVVFEYKLVVHNLPEVLLRYRVIIKSEFLPWHHRVLESNLKRLAIAASKVDLKLHQAISTDTPYGILTSYTSKAVFDWLDILYTANITQKLVSEDSMHKFLCEYAKSIIVNSPNFYKAIIQYRSTNLGKNTQIFIIMKYFLRWILQKFRNNQFQ